MTLSDPSDHSRFLAYALTLSRSATVLREYRTTGNLPQDKLHKLIFARDHLGRFARAQELLAAPSGKIVPDLESVQVYQAVIEALEAAGLPFDRAHPGIAVDALILTLAQVLDGILPEEVGTGELKRLELTLDALASIYAVRAEHLG
jgi:hypothetical protein